MTVGQLRAALVNVPDDLDIVVRASDDGGDVCTGLHSASVEYSHDENDTPFFALDAFEES